MFENVTVIGRPLVLSSPAEVYAAEAQLGVRFPTGYREYVTRFGEGVLGGTYVRIYPPRRIVSGDGNVRMEFNQGEWGDEMTMSYRPDPRLAEAQIVNLETAFPNLPAGRMEIWLAAGS